MLPKIADYWYSLTDANPKRSLELAQLSNVERGDHLHDLRRLSKDMSVLYRMVALPLSQMGFREVLLHIG